MIERSQVLPVTGYFDRVSARPGGRLEVKVSAEGGGTYAAEVVQIVSGDPNPAGPGLVYRDRDFGLAGIYPARRQEIDIGSHAIIPADPCVTGPAMLFAVLVQPGLLRDTEAVIASALDAQGHGWELTATTAAVRFAHRSAGATHEVSLPVGLKRWRWVHLWAGYDSGTGRLTIGCAPHPGGPVATATADADLAPLPAAPLVLAARRTGPLAQGHFNGRLEDPAIHASLPAPDTAPPLPAAAPSGALLAWWDFAIGIDTQSIVDRGPRGLGGRLVNIPYRGMRGAAWSARHMHWRDAPREYAAIHFHEDDLHDCGWQTDFALTIPDGTPSGVYGLRLRKGDAQDIVPFYVLPPKDGPRHRVCFLASTFTHQAYANHARGNCDDAMRDRMRDWGASPYNADDYPIYGRSTYNFHPDGTGTSISSRLRPVLTARPGYLTFTDAAGSGLRHFSADTHLLNWLDARGIGFDVITDEDLDDEGPDLIAGYPCVMTGSHPEYHTAGMLDTLQGYSDRGGRFMYLGGNGFYWKIARIPALPGVIELRRAEGGIRAWATAPGESHHQIDGGYGGLWRRNGRPPQSVAAVGFSAQGLFESTWYRRMPDSYRPEAAWIFDGVGEARLGDYGLSGGGAAGFELDRADFDLGTPEGTLILARSENHPASFVTVPEELLSHIATVTGEAPDDLIRSEIVYCAKPGGGAIFAVGSICFCGSLNHNGGDNGISRMIENVVRRFAGR